MRRILRRCLWFALFTLLSASAFAQAPPTDDTYSNGGSKTQKNGSSIFLVVQHGFDSYIKFNLATLPANPNIAKATLRLYVDAVVGGGSFDVYQLNSSWNENTLTYNNAPALGISATGSHPVAITASSLNQFVLIDITSLVQGWANGTIPNNGVALALTTSGGSFSFDSKESVLTSHHPELEIALNGAVGPQGPAGATGATGPAGAAGAQGPAGAAGAQGAQGTPGATGAQGPQGLMGLTGLQGPQGDQGPAGTNGTGFNFTGPFSNATSYNVNDVATYNGSTYVATVANQGGNTPDQNTADWTLMAQAGATGPAGAAGAQGAQGPQGTPGAAGAQGPIGQTGANGAQGPQGLLGPIGPQGATGPQGPAGTSSGGVLYVVPFSTTPTFDASQGSVLEITLTGNVTSSTFANATAGQTISIILCQDSVGGHTFVPPVNVQWSTVGTTTPSYCAAEQFAFDGTTAYYLGPIAYQVIAPIVNLTGSGLALSMNGGTVPVPAAATMVSLPSLYSGQTYQLSVAQQPTAPVQTCTLAGNTVGIVQAMNVSVPVNCIGAAGAPTNPVLTSQHSTNLRPAGLRPLPMEGQR